MAMVPNSAEINQPASPLCSVCIANYNGEKFIEQCIDSVLRQENFPGTVEIIVHDDASTDNSVSVIKDRYPQVRLLLSDTNVGFCISNNKMVNVAQGRFILLLNNDAILHTHALMALHGASIEHGEGIYGLPQYDAMTGELIDVGSFFDPFLNPVPNRDFHRNDVGMVIGACFWLSKLLWEILGGFPEWFGSLAEDMYLCCLARLKGFPVIVVTSSKFFHCVGKSYGGGKVVDKKLSTTLSRRALSERNKTFVMLICYPSFTVYMIFPLHILLLIIEGVFLAFVKRKREIWLKIYLSCLIEICSKRNIWIQQREMIQRGSSTKTCDFFAVFTLLPHKVRMLCNYGMPKLR